MRVKICGLTSLDDALAAAEAGADMLGFNFYPASPRRLSPARCAEIVGGLQAHGLSVETVGVFVNASPASVASTLETCALGLAQLHGDEPLADLEGLDGRAFKAVRPQSLAEAMSLARRYGPSVASEPALLIDARVGNNYGGTGVQADWAIAGQLAREFPLLLAGGLSPRNVGEAIQIVRPWGVDVASGVEAAPGRKDRRQMAAFVQAVREIEREIEDAE